MLALLLTLCANKVCNTQSETFNDTKITSSTTRRQSRRNGIHELLNLNSAISNETIGSTFSSTLYLNVTQFYRVFSQACRLVLFHLKSYITVNSCQRFLDFSDDLIFNFINFSSFCSRAKSF